MREILFKGKRADNGEWVYGYLYITHIGEYGIGYYDAQSNIERMTYCVIPETVGQYTGLTDKNGKKIFDSDIVKIFDGIHKYELYTIKFIEGSFCVANNDCTLATSIHYISNVLKNLGEVIGNIYDNPELLEVK